MIFTLSTGSWLQIRYKQSICILGLWIFGVLGSCAQAVAVRTLIIEDSSAARNFLKLRFTEIGCEVIGEAGDASEGLKLIRELRPQLVSLDLLLPLVNEIDALTLFRTVRKESPETKFIVISASSRATERASFMREGAVEYFEKPFFNFQALVGKLAQFFPEIRDAAPRDPRRRL